ncbi:MAG TPA: gamma-glutamyl-gamma-aminobutyrate hydrolase family protein [Terriglobales bacterium]|nr:gamma-glutamyl-gamma-aminobutyrate hydrolase family protein [Terriglobales bacterium]
MRPRIAIPVPHSRYPDYVQRSLPQYEHAIEMAGGEAVRIPLDKPSPQLMELIERCDGVLLPGSSADVDPAKYEAPRHLKTADADSKRDAIDELLLNDAYEKRKPILGICYGLQILNVNRKGTLLQHIESEVNHEAGKNVPVAHNVVIEPKSKLAEIVGISSEDKSLPVNSSHHQSAAKIGNGLQVVATSPHDNIIEAVEGTSPNHFVLAVQWHPERSVDQDEPSRAIFRALVEAAKAKHKS